MRLSAIGGAGAAVSGAPASSGVADVRRMIYGDVTAEGMNALRDEAARARAASAARPSGGDVFSAAIDRLGAGSLRFLGRSAAAGADELPSLNPFPALRTVALVGAAVLVLLILK